MRAREREIIRQRERQAKNEAAQRRRAEEVKQQQAEKEANEERRRREKRAADEAKAAREPGPVLSQIHRAHENLRDPEEKWKEIQAIQRRAENQGAEEQREMILDRRRKGTNCLGKMSWWPLLFTARCSKCNFRVFAWPHRHNLYDLVDCEGDKLSSQFALSLFHKLPEVEHGGKEATYRCFYCEDGEMRTFSNLKDHVQDKHVYFDLWEAALDIKANRKERRSQKKEP